MRYGEAMEKINLRTVMVFVIFSPLRWWCEQISKLLKTMSITIVKERHYNAALNTMGKVSKAQDRLIKRKEELIVEQRKMQAHPYTRMKATSSMLRKIKQLKKRFSRLLRVSRELAPGLGQLLKQLDLREIATEATRRGLNEIN